MAKSTPKQHDRRALIDAVNGEPVVRLFRGETPTHIIPCRDRNDAKEIGEYYILTGQVMNSI